MGGCRGIGVGYMILVGCWVVSALALGMFFGVLVFSTCIWCLGWDGFGAVALFTAYLPALL